jgi:putative nucleotide binding protein
MEDFAYILDYLVSGLPNQRRFRREPVAYGIGDSEFKILELTPKSDVTINIGERVYIGKEMEERKKIAHVKRRIGYNDLTSAAQSELPYVLLDIVKTKEEYFVKFFNGASPITTRFHALELLPGLGRKTLLSLLEERKKGLFSSFEDIGKRTMLKQPEKIITKRIEIELSDPHQKYYLFVQKPKKEEY